MIMRITDTAVRCDQDVLENHSSPLQFKFQLGWYIIGKHVTAIFTENRNTEENVGTC